MAAVSVIPVLSVSVLPASRVISAGATLSLSASTSGGSSPANFSYKWLSLDGPVVGTGDTLRIPNFQPAQAGTYYVVITDNLATHDGIQIAQSNQVQISMAHTQAPNIVFQSNSQTVIVGTTVTLNVRVTGTPPFQYQWMKNGVDLVDATSFAMSLPNVNIEGMPGSTP